jgi:hypothetical protein
VGGEIQRGRMPVSDTHPSRTGRPAVLPRPGPTVAGRRRRARERSRSSRAPGSASCGCGPWVRRSSPRAEADRAARPPAFGRRVLPAWARDLGPPVLRLLTELAAPRPPAGCRALSGRWRIGRCECEPELARLVAGRRRFAGRGTSGPPWRRPRCARSARRPSLPPALPIRVHGQWQPRPGPGRRPGPDQHARTSRTVTSGLRAGIERPGWVTGLQNAAEIKLNPEIISVITRYKNIQLVKLNKAWISRLIMAAWTHIR